MDILFETLNFETLDLFNDNGIESDIWTDYIYAYKLYLQKGREDVPDYQRKRMKIDRFKRYRHAHFLYPFGQIQHRGECQGTYLQYVNADKFLKNHFSFSDFVRIFREISREVKAELHSKEIVMADFNMQNILLDKEKNWYVVDLDGAQIEDLPFDRVSYSMALFLDHHSLAIPSLAPKGFDMVNLYLNFFDCIFKRKFYLLPWKELYQKAHDAGFSAEIIEVLESLYRGVFSYSEIPSLEQVLPETMEKPKILEFS